MLKTLTFIRHNAIALLALFVALGGTSYALSIPDGSVGTRQLQNGAVTAKKIANRSITPIKFDPSTIGGAVRHWAFISSDGSVIGGSRGIRASAPTQPGQPYHVSWGDQFSHSCVVLADSPGTEGNGPIADRIGIHVNEPGSRHGATVVWAWPSSESTFVNARFYITVIC